MKKTLSKARRFAVLLVLSSTVAVFTGGAFAASTDNIPHANDPQRVKAFTRQIDKVAHEVSKMDGYKRIPLDSTEEQEWFAAIAFEYWDKQISKEEFISEGLKRFPDYRASFETLADHLLP